jgi:hypothetical protein
MGIRAAGSNNGNGTQLAHRKPRHQLQSGYSCNLSEEPESQYGRRQAVRFLRVDMSGAAGPGKSFAACASERGGLQPLQSLPMVEPYR